MHQLIEQDRLSGLLLQKYPQAHDVRTDKALYDFVLELKKEYLRNAGQLSKVMFDGKLHSIKNALGMHTMISRVQGANLKTKREIRIAAVFKEMPPEFLRMIVVHELAHMKERDHLTCGLISLIWMRVERHCGPVVCKCVSSFAILLAMEDFLSDAFITCIARWTEHVTD